MADRGASTEIVTELSASQNRPVHLVSVETSGGVSYMNDSYKTISFDDGTGSHDYLGLGYFLGFSEIEETAALQISSLTLSLTGVDQTLISIFLSNQYIDRTVKIYKAMLDSTDTLIVDPILIFEGRMDQPVISEDPENGTATVAVSVANQFVDWERTQYRTTNHENQQIHFPGDKGFEFASEVNDEIFWGRLPT